MLVAAWRASPALRERVGKLAEAHGCTAASREAVWTRRPCFPTEDGAAWSDGSLVVSIGETCTLQCAAPTQRSLYVMREDGALLVSSSLPLLLAVRRPSLSVRALAACVLAIGLPDRVPYAGIERVEAGAAWSYEASGARTATAYEPTLESTSTSDPEGARARLEAAIGSAVDGAIHGSERVGILLSGGLDSSAILAALAERVPASRIVPITWELGGLSGDRPFVAAWEARLGLRVERVEASAAARLLADSLVLGGAPTALMTGAFERAAMRRAKERGADVLLTGVGGDESFAGSLQAAVRSRATPWQSVQRALFAELPWGSTAHGRLSELVVRPALRPLAPRALRERNFVRRTRAQLPALGRVALDRLRDAARLHVGVVPPVPRTPTERFHELARRPFWLEMGELRAQLEAAEGLPRFDVPLDVQVHRAVAAIEPHLLLTEHRHRGLLRRVLQGRAPQVVAARLDKADFDDFGHRILRESKVEPRLRALARGTRLGEMDVVPAGEIERRWSALATCGFPEDLTTFLGWWPFLSAEALAEEHA